MGRADELRKWVGTTGEDDTEKNGETQCGERFNRKTYFH